MEIQEGDMKQLCKNDKVKKMIFDDINKVGKESKV